MPALSLLFIFPIPIGGSPKDLGIATADFTHPTPSLKIGIFWRKFVATLAVRQATKMVIFSLWESRFSDMSGMIQYLKVRGVAAISSFAEVMNFKSWWNRTGQQFIGEPVNILSFPDSVSSDSTCASPTPAARTADDNTLLHALGQSAKLNSHHAGPSMAEKLCWGQFRRVS